MTDWQALRRLARERARFMPWTEQYETQIEREEPMWFGLRARKVSEINKATRAINARLLTATATQVVDDNGRFEGPLDGDYCMGWALRLVSSGELEYCSWSYDRGGLYPTYVPEMTYMTGWAIATDEQLSLTDFDWVSRSWGTNPQSGTHYWRVEPRPTGRKAGEQLATHLNRLK